MRWQAVEAHVGDLGSLGSSEREVRPWASPLPLPKPEALPRADLTVICSLPLCTPPGRQFLFPRVAGARPEEHQQPRPPVALARAPAPRTGPGGFQRGPGKGAGTRPQR